ncbi:MAG: ComF family protein [Marinilabiliaceae bacterium]|nr:ComF family protein [Marinilabiliaceae bacterium]
MANNSQIKKLFDGFVALLFPEVCKKCGKDLFAEEILLCKRCCSKLPQTGFEHSNSNPVAQLLWGKVNIEHAFALFYFRKGETLQKIIHLLKYKRNTKAGELLGKIAGKKLKELSFVHNIDYLIPVPLHPKKMKIRGYNQCDILSDTISKFTNIPVQKNILIRNIYNVSQTKKGKFDRWKNVEGIFKLTQTESLEGKHILLIDDVITTGSTLEACCHTLLQIPNVKVSLLSIGFSSN